MRLEADPLSPGFTDTDLSGIMVIRLVTYSNQKNVKTKEIFIVVQVHPFHYR